jgi:hypothetical protein
MEKVDALFQKMEQCEALAPTVGALFARMQTLKVGRAVGRTAT